MDRLAVVKANFERVAALCRAFNAEDFGDVSQMYAPEVRGYRPELAQNDSDIKFRTFSNPVYIEHLKMFRQQGTITIVRTNRNCDLVVVDVIFDRDGSRGIGTFGFNSDGLIDFVFLRPVDADQVSAA
jgi:hypothetical protein